MPLPTPPVTPIATTDREPVKRNFNDLDSLLSELNTPKEVISSTPPPPRPGLPGQPSPPPAAAPANPDPFAADVPAEAEPMPDELAKLSGKTIANTIDTAFGTGACLYAKNSQPEKYQATDKQMRNLEDAWAAVAKKYNYKVEDSPWFNVGVLTLATYFPKLQDAKHDRQFAIMNERITETEIRLKKLEEIEKAKAATVQSA